METSARTCTDSATPFQGESLPLATLLSLAATVRHTRARTSVNEYRVLSFALTHAGFYAQDLFDAYKLRSAGAINEVYSTLGEMSRTGLLCCQAKGNRNIYYCTNQGRKEAAKQGAALVAQANQVLQSMKLNRYCKQELVMLIP